MGKVLVTGGVRSGKSTYAEGLLADEPAVTYVAPGPVPDGSDPDWQARVRAHRERRPPHWTTVETSDVAAAVAAAEGAVLLDCLGTWVTALLDELGAWDAVDDRWRSDLDRRVDDLVRAWEAAPGSLVAVTNEVGMGVVPAHRSGRVFRDVLGTVNQAVAGRCDDVVLVVAGRTLHV